MVLPWSVIVEPGCVVESHRPQAFIEMFFPHDGCVDHHRTGFPYDGLDGTFGESVLVMGVGTTEGDRLMSVFTVVNPNLGVVGLVVGMIVFDDVTELLHITFVVPLRVESDVWRITNLIVESDEAGVVIEEDGTTCELPRRWFLPVSVPVSTGNGTAEIVHRCHLAWTKRLSLHGSFIVGIFRRLLSRQLLLLGFRELARQTLGGLALARLEGLRPVDAATCLGFFVLLRLEVLWEDFFLGTENADRKGTQPDENLGGRDVDDPVADVSSRH